MSKLGLIVKREYLAKVRNRSFVVMTFLSPLLLVGMVVLIAYLTEINDSDKKLVSVLNESRYFHGDFLPNQGVSFIEFKDISLQEAKDSTRSLAYDALLHIPSSADIEAASKSAFLLTKDSPSSELLNRLESIFQRRLRKQRLNDIGVSQESFADIEEKYTLRTTTFDGEENLKGINELKAFIGGAFGYLIMMFIIIYGGFVMRSVIEEKTSRIIEVIISSVKPFQLMLGKIIGTSLAGVTQFAIWIFSASLLLFFAFLLFDIDVSALTTETAMPAPTMQAMSTLSENKGDFEKYVKELLRFPWFLLIAGFLVYFVLGYLIYSSIYAAIGAAVDNETDTQQFIFPIILPLMLGIYVGFFSVFGNPNGPIAVGFSLFPLTSPIVMLMRLPAGLGEGGVPIWQLILSIVLLLLTFLAIVWLAAKIYRVGILMYGKKPTYKELYKWLKY